MVDGPDRLFPEPLHGSTASTGYRPVTPIYRQAWERIFGKRKRKPRRRRTK